MSLTDSCGRPLLNLRISITQRCNNRCAYCHREGEVQRANRSAELMSAEEIIRIAKIAVGLGISRLAEPEEGIDKVSQPADEQRDHQPVNVNHQIIHILAML